ncbi:MAG: histidine kinase [Clostridiaceae bacterium]|nr:histidine kinase [Clostridiaceae bacterium]
MHFRQSIFGILLTVFLLVVLPIYLAGFLVYDWGIRQVKSEISRSIEAKNRSAIDAMDTSLRATRNHLSSLLNNRDVRLLAVSGRSMPEIERIFLIRQIQDHLRLFMVSNPTAAGIVLHVPEIGRSIDVLGGVTLLSESQYRSLDQAATEAAGQICLADGAITLFLAYPQQVVARSRPSTYMLEITFAREVMTRNLAIMADDSNLALFSERYDILLAATDQDEAPARFFRSGYLAAPAAARPAHFSGQMTFDGEAYLVTIDSQAATDLMLVGYTPLGRVYQPLQRYQPLFWAFTAIVVVLAVLFFILLFRLLRQPLRQFAAAFRHVEQGRFDLQLTHQHRDEFHDLYTGFNAMVAKLHLLVDQVYRQTIYAQQAELKQLQSQISPHFLYNSFFVLQNMADNGETEALSTYANQMGRYFQYITRNDKPDATLAEEVGHARIYATLQTRRFRNRLTLCFDPLPDALAACPVPRLVLQPILENAFEHGLKNKVEDGYLAVQFARQDLCLQITVADNGDGLTPDGIMQIGRLLEQKTEPVAMTGLINVHRRLQLRFGPAFGLSVRATPGGGLTVQVRLPCPEESR